MIAFLRRFCHEINEASNETKAGSNRTFRGGQADEAILYAYTAAIAACSKPAPNSLSSSKDPNYVDNSQYRSKAFLLQLLEEMENGFDRRIFPSSYTLSAVLIGIDDGLDALNLLETFVDRYGQDAITVQVYNVVLASFSGEKYNTNGWHHAISLLQRMKRHGPQPNEQSFSYVVQSCAGSGQLKVALSLLEEVRQLASMETTPKLYLPILKVCAKAGHSDVVLSLINKMQDDSIQITTMHMNLYLQSLSKAGLQIKALGVLRGMIQESDPMQVPDLISFNTVLSACANGNDYEAAQALFDQMKEEVFDNIRPDVVSFNTLISCAPPLVGLNLINEMRLTRRNREGVVFPNSVTFVNAIKQCREYVKEEIDPDIRNQIFDIALTVLGLAREDRISLNIFVYSAAIWIAEAVGDTSVALKLLQELNKDTLQRTNDDQFRSTYSACYDGVISALSKDGLYREALALYHYEMQPLKLPSTRNTYKSIVHALDNANNEEVKNSQSKKAALLEGVLSRMTERDRTVEVGGPLFEGLIKLHGEAGSFKAAKMAFDSIIGPCDEPCLSAILRVCSSTTPTHWKEAVLLTHSSDVVWGARGPGMIPTRALSVSCWFSHPSVSVFWSPQLNSIFALFYFQYAVIACAKSDEWKEALNLIDLYGIDLKYRRATAKLESSGLVSVNAINSVIRACSRDSRPDVAVQILNDMQTKYNIVPNETTFRLAIIACNHAEHRERRQRRNTSDASNPLEFQWWECSLSLLRRMREAEIRPSVQAYSSVVSSCEAAGKWQRAIGVLQSMREEGEIPNLYCLNAAISACEKGGAWVEALELYESIRSQRNSSIRPNFITVSSLLIALEKASQVELAESIYQGAMRDKVVSPWVRRYDTDGTLRRMMDLHKFSAPMAKIAVREYLESMLTRKKKAIRGDTIFIVGKGKGSE
jgi:pentatricopeptide repeat domain-containing protein 1